MRSDGGKTSERVDSVLTKLHVVNDLSDSTNKAFINLQMI